MWGLKKENRGLRLRVFAGAGARVYAMSGAGEVGGVVGVCARNVAEHHWFKEGVRSRAEYLSHDLRVVPTGNFKALPPVINTWFYGEGYTVWTTVSHSASTALNLHVRLLYQRCMTLTTLS
jgi:hypothetical protein